MNEDTTVEDAKALLDEDPEGFILVTMDGTHFQEVYNTPHTPLTEAMQEHPYVLLMAYAMAQFDALDGKDLEIEQIFVAILDAAQQYYNVSVDYHFEYDD